MLKTLIFRHFCAFLHLFTKMQAEIYAEKFRHLWLKSAEKSGGEDLASKNEEKLLQNLEMLKDWASVGISQKEMARRLEMSYSDFRVWRDKIPALSALFEKTPDEKKKAKMKRVEIVAESLYDRCNGYNARVKKFVKVKKALRDDDGKLIYEKGKVVMEEELVEIEEEQHVPGDVGAQKFYLMNQARKDWKSDPEKLAHDKQRVKNDTKRTSIAEQNAGGQPITGKTVEELLAEMEAEAGDLNV